MHTDRQTEIRTVLFIPQGQDLSVVVLLLSSNDVLNITLVLITTLLACTDRVTMPELKIITTNLALFSWSTMKK